MEQLGRYNWKSGRYISKFADKSENVVDIF
jgi:hypothetical protein